MEVVRDDMMMLDAEDAEARLGMRPIMYIEDRTYTYIPSAHGRMLVRRWRHMLERLHGLYNVIDSHKCNERCFGSLGMQMEAKKTDSTLDLRRTTTTTTTTTTPSDPNAAPVHEEPLIIEVISTQHSLYGCPRSGIVHVCSDSIEMRRRFCEAQITDLDGALRCRFSGKPLSENEFILNPFTDDTIHVQDTKPRNGKGERERRAVSGEGRETAATAASRNTLAHVQKTAEHQYQQSQMRNIQALLKRRENDEASHSNTTASPVVPSMTVADQLGFPTKILTHSDINILRNHQTASSNAPENQSAAAATTTTNNSKIGKRKNANGIDPRHMPLPGGFTISKETHGKILRFVKSVLANSAANAYIRHPTTALSLANDHPDNQFLRFIAQRICIVYCLVTSQGKRDKPNAKAAKKQGQAACLNVNIRELVITMLYVFKNGFNTDRGANLIAADTQLQALLPPTSSLVYYGLSADVLKEIQTNDQHLDMRTIEAMSEYKESMYNIANNKLQRVILGADEPGGIGREKLTRVLNTNLMDFAKDNNQ